MDCILQIEGKLYKNCNRTHVRYIFQIDEPLDLIEVHFSYAPKKLENKEAIKESLFRFIDEYTEEGKVRLLETEKELLALDNLLSISIDDEQGFRGNGHRPSPNQIIQLSEKVASPGYIPGAINRGTYQLTISAQAVLTEFVTYHIKVLGKRKS